MNRILNNTPVEQYNVKGRPVYIKREDLCTKPPAPPFSKCRGLLPHMKKLKESVFEIVGYVETSISMAGWAVAWCAKELDLKVVIYEPKFKDKPSSDLMVGHKEMWAKFDVTIEPIPAARTCVNYYIARKLIKQKYGRTAYLLPTGIPSNETVIETGREYRRTIEDIGTVNYVVICVGSGTICSGILRELKSNEGQIIGVLCREGSLSQKRVDILNKTSYRSEGLFLHPNQLRLINEGWEYTQKSEVSCPFPCHPYYDLKAWEWLVKNISNLSGRILFWNIGNEYVVL